MADNAVDRPFGNRPRVHEQPSVSRCEDERETVHRFGAGCSGRCHCRRFSAIGVHAEEAPKEEPAAVQTAAQDEAPKPDTSDIFQEWLDNNHELGKGDTECLMCVGFGGGFRCGIGCDATGLTIHKPDGSTNAVCGRCVKGEWQ